MRSVVGAAKLLVFFLSALFTLAYQSTVLLFTKGEFALRYPRAYHAFLCRLFGIKVIVEGDIETGRDLVYLGNHLSYLDIEALGSIVKGCFVAKKELADWPFFAQMGAMQRTVHISRDPKHAARETNMLLERLDEGLPLIIFPEGTSSNGTSILPFKSSFFQIFLNKNIRIQPFTISLISVDEENAASDSVRDRYAWHGNMDLEPHLWRFSKMKGAVVKIQFQKAFLSSGYIDRKQLCADIYESVSKGLDLSPLSK